MRLTAAKALREMRDGFNWLLFSVLARLPAVSPVPSTALPHYAHQTTAQPWPLCGPSGDGRFLFPFSAHPTKRRSRPLAVTHAYAYMLYN